MKSNSSPTVGGARCSDYYDSLFENQTSIIEQAKNFTNIMSGVIRVKRSKHSTEIKSHWNGSDFWLEFSKTRISNSTV